MRYVGCTPCYNIRKLGLFPQVAGIILSIFLQKSWKTNKKQPDEDGRSYGSTQISLSVSDNNSRGSWGFQTEKFELKPFIEQSGMIHK